MIKRVNASRPPIITGNNSDPKAPLFHKISSEIDKIRGPSLAQRLFNPNSRRSLIGRTSVWVGRNIIPDYIRRKGIRGIKGVPPKGEE